jgi:hypothetical protein
LAPSLGDLNSLWRGTYRPFFFGDRLPFVAYADPLEGTFIACENLRSNTHPPSPTARTISSRGPRLSDHRSPPHRSAEHRADAERIAALLSGGAGLERRAGEIFLRLGKTQRPLSSPAKRGSIGPESSRIESSASGSSQSDDPERRRLRSMKAKDLDRAFDAGADITEFLDLSKARRPKQEQKRVNVDFPIWMIQSLDREAKHLGVPRQSLIKVLIAEHLEKAKKT